MKIMRLLLAMLLAATLPQTFFATESPSLDENLLRKEVTVATSIAQIKITEVQKLINEARQQALQGIITSADAIKVIKEQNAIITQIENELAARLNKAIDAEENYFSSFVLGAQDLGRRAIAPFKAGYRYTSDQKKTAQKIIDGLMEQQMRLAKDYEQAKENSQLTAIEQTTLKKRYETIIAELNDEIYQQQLITGAVMSIERKLFWGAVAAGAAVAGMYFLAPGTEITPVGVEKIKNVTIDVGKQKSSSIATFADRTVNVEQSEVVVAEQPMEAGIKQTKEPELPIEETEITTPEEIAQLLKESHEDRAQQAERDVQEEELLNKRIQWQDELWLYRDATNRAFEKFAQEHTPPVEVQKLIEENKEKILDYSYLPLKGKDGSYVAVAKGDDVTRIFNANAVKKFIEENDLTSLEVPKKWIYNVDGYEKLFAEYIQGEPITQKNPLNLKETQDLVTFVEKTGYSDFWDNSNILRGSRTGKLAFIDVENDSFSPEIPIIGQISRLNRVMAMDSEAQQWLEDHWEKLQQNSGTLSGYLPQRKKWDEDFKNWSNHPDRLKNTDRAVNYYLPLSDQQRISRKVTEKNWERATQPEEEKRRDIARKAEEEARRLELEKIAAEAAAERREAERMGANISAELIQNSRKAQQALDEYKQKMGENIDSEELARLENAVQDAQNAKDNYLQELLEKYLK